MLATIGNTVITVAQPDAPTAAAAIASIPPVVPSHTLYSNVALQPLVVYSEQPLHIAQQAQNYELTDT